MKFTPEFCGLTSLPPVLEWLGLHTTNDSVAAQGLETHSEWKGMYKKIVIALDESNEAKHALTTAIALAKQLGSELRIVTVSEPLPVYAAFMDSELPGARQKLLEERNSFYAHLQKDGIKQASAAGVKVDAAIIEGKEVDSIAQHITAFGADLLVIGRRHHAAMSGIWSGTVHNVAEKVCCSILAVC